MYSCEVCGEAATIHMTEIKDGIKADKHRCPAHAPETLENTPLHSIDQRLGAVILTQYKKAAAYIRQHGRLPDNAEEYQNFTSPPDAPPATEITDPEIKEKLEQLEKLIRFIELHGKAPTVADLSSF